MRAAVNFVELPCSLLASAPGRFSASNDHWTLVFNPLLPVTAMSLSGVILVADARDTAAIQPKRDELIRAIDHASDLLVGIEERGAKELELLRQAKTSHTPTGE